MFESMFKDVLAIILLICLWVSLIPLYDLLVGEAEKC